MKAAIATALVLALVGCASVPSRPSVSALPKPKQYSSTFRTELKAEQPIVKTCCPRTNEAMYDYGRLIEKLKAGEAIQTRTVVKQGGVLSSVFGK